MSEIIPSQLLASKLFPVQDLELVGTVEKSVKGGRHMFPLVASAFKDIKQIAVIGWGSQGPSHAQNLRDTLETVGSKTKVVVGLRSGSSSFEDAKNAGFSDNQGTLLEMFDAIRKSDMVIVLISDAAQADLMPKIMAAMKSEATLGLAHGFILGHMQSTKQEWREDINVVMLAPKGMGPSVRALYIQGKETEGAGINASIAIEQDYTGNATDLAIGWGIGIGSPYIFQTTMESEYKSDIFGERGDLIGGVWGLVEVLYEEYFEDGMPSDEAFENTVESLTGPISNIISEQGLIGLYNYFANVPDEKKLFEIAYSRFYNPSMTVLEEIYDEVSSGREIKEVIYRGQHSEEFPMEKIDGAEMWKVGKDVRENRIENQIPLNPYTAGAYTAMIMAQVDLLSSKGHPWSEIANESVIEATDSLNPYMHKAGIDYMANNCSITARRGTYKWGPKFKKSFSETFDDGITYGLLSDFLIEQPIHEVLEKVGEMRPSVKIAL